MAKTINTLPKDFVIDETPKAGLPEGFELDTESVNNSPQEAKPQGDWDVLKGYIDKKQPREFTKKYNEMNKPEWDKDAGRFKPDVTHPETYWANGALDLKDITQGTATLAGKALKGVFVDLPTEIYDRAKNHKPLITGQDLSNAWETTKTAVPEVAKAIANPYIEAVKGNFTPILQNPITSTLDILGAGELGKVAKLGKLRGVGSEIAELATNPKKYVAKSSRPVGLSGIEELPKDFQVDVKPEINDLVTERPLKINEFKKVFKEETGAKAVRSTKYDEYLSNGPEKLTTDEVKSAFKDNIDSMAVNVAKKEYITNSKKGNFWKSNVTTSEQQAFIDADTELNKVLKSIKKNPEFFDDDTFVGKTEENLLNQVGSLPGGAEVQSEYWNKFYNAVESARNYNNDISKAVKSKPLPRKTLDELTQKYYQKYGQKLKNPNYPNEKIVLDNSGKSAAELFDIMKAENTTKPIFSEQEMDDRIGKIFNKHSKYAQARNLEIEKQVTNITKGLSKSEKLDLAKYLQDPASFNSESLNTLSGKTEVIKTSKGIVNDSSIKNNPKIIQAAKTIQALVNENTDALIKGGYITEDTAKNNPYRQAVVSRWIQKNAKNFTPTEIKQLAESGELKTYANVTPDEVAKMKAEYEGLDVQPTYLNVNYGDRNLLDKAKQKLGLEPDAFDFEQPVSILNKRKYGLSPKIDVDKSLNTYLKSVEKLEANKKIINEITHSFSMPLEEFGKVKKGYTVWSPELMLQEIREKGYAKADDIIKEYLSKSAEDIYRASTKAGLPIYQIPERAAKTLSGYYYTPKGVDKALNQLNQPFKRYALATGRFIVNNTSNNLINNMIEGVPFNAYKAANNPELQNIFPAELQNVGFFGSEKNKSIPAIEKGINAVTNKILPFDKTQNLMTKGIDWIFDTNSNIENSIFRANYIKQMQDLAKKQGVGLEEILNNPQVQDLALENTYKSLGDYSTKRPIYNAPMWEDGLSLTSVVPFARPFVEQSKVMANQFMNRPLEFNALVAKPAQIGSEMARDQEQEFEKNGRPLKEYQRRALYQGYYYDTEGNLQKEPDISKVPPKGKPVLYDSSSFLPHSIIGDYTEGSITELAGKLNPIVGLVASTISGNKFGEIPLTSPDREWGQPMSESDKATYLASQIARTYTPAGTIEKMLPYRSYDSQLFAPDGKQRAKTPFYYSSRFFGGAEMVGPKAKKAKKGKRSKRKKSKLPEGFEIDSTLPNDFKLDK